MTPFLAAYCERAGAAGALAEPLNALTNAAFLVAAVLIWRELQASADLSLRCQWDIAALAAVVFVIGIGSAAWHIWPVRPTLLADVIPITVFIHVYLAVFIVRVLGLSWGWAVAIVAVYVAASFLVPPLLSTEALSGTAAYLPAYAMLAIMSAVLFATRDPRKWPLALALAIWTVSLLLRSVDGVACPWLPTGTHFLWHLSNAAVLFILLRILTCSASDAAAARPGGRA